MPFNWGNSTACERAAELRRIYFERIGPGGVKLVRTKSLDNEREVQFYNADLSVLRAELQRAEDECRVEQGLPPIRRRFAMLAGSRRLPTPSRSITDE